MAELSYNDDLLIRYLDGELSDEERTAVEERLRGDEKLKEQLTRLQAAVQAVKHLGTAENVASIHTEMMRELRTEQNKRVIPMRKTVRYLMAVAASVAVLFVGIRLYQAAQLSPEKLYDEAFIDFNVSTSRSSGTGLSEIENRYQQKQYEAVTESVRFTGLNAQDSLLVGLSYLHTGHPSRAIGVLQRLASSSNEVQPDAEFYLALSFVKNRDYGRALPLLQKIAGNPLHLYHERVTEDLVEKVKKLNDQ